jgi:Ca2+-transporting ATPase
MIEYTGLTEKEAQKLFKKCGLNVIHTESRQTPLSLFISQFTSFLVVMLIIASIAALLLGDAIDGFFILLIVFLNGILGFAQEYKADKAIEALKRMTISTVRVIREGTEQKIDSSQLVPGDIVKLEEGDKIPADCIVLNSLHFEVNEASLTGESIPVAKESHSESNNKIYSGTIVVSGRAVAEVIATGMNTRFGKIATSLSEIEKEQTPLQKKITLLGKQLGIFALIAALTVFILGFLKGQPLFDMILLSISLAVAAVPEGLPAVITITLAMGMRRMASKQAILRKLSSIEALGSATVIATDKTGTLTKNEMQVVKIWSDDASFENGSKNINFHKQTMQYLIKTAVLCNNASLTEDEIHKKHKIIGDSTEGALLLFAHENGNKIEQIKKRNSFIEEFSFDPTLKLMSSVWKSEKEYVLYAKGAPETILQKSDRIIINDTIVPMTSELKKRIHREFELFAKEGLRVLALSYRDHFELTEDRNTAEQHLIFLGFVGISDPPRKEVRNAIQIAKTAGIETIMITGDNALTAHAIGVDVGLIEKDDTVLTGPEIATFDDKQLMLRLKDIRVFARTTPDQKYRIVKLLQSMGHIVSVTGDGVNDALALKQADIGVAMGITGTDVAKEAADMIITDDNYATIVSAVEEGRTIFDNIKAAIKYLVGCNLGEIFVVVFGVMMGLPLLLTPLQLLYINLVTDGLPALALAITPKQKNIMKQKPRSTNNIFNRKDLFWFAEVSVLTTIATLGAFLFAYKQYDLITARTWAFTTLILVQQFILIDVWVREESILKRDLVHDKNLFIIFALTLLLQPILLYIPVFSQVFKVTPLSVLNIFLIVIIASVLLLFSEFRKRVLTKDL